MLTVENLHTYYGDSHVLHGVSLQVSHGTVAAVVGRNGVGKTTLCRSIVGFAPARAGRVMMGEVDITHWAPHRICERRLNLVPQGRRLFPSLTVAEHLAIAAQPPREDAATGWDVQRICTTFPRLAERRTHRAGELSGGEQQMLAIARALMSNPTLLVMDEPTEGLSPALVAVVGGLIAQLKAEGRAVLLVEQNASFALKLADYAYVMARGTIVHAGDPAALWEDAAITSQFLGIGSRSTTQRTEGAEGT